MLLVQDESSNVLIAERDGDGDGSSFGILHGLGEGFRCMPRAVMVAEVEVDAMLNLPS